MRKVTLLFLMLTLVLFLSACSGKDKTVSVFISGDTIPLRYADNLTLVNYPDYTIATLRNPWDTLKTLHTYILVPASQPLPVHLPEGTIVRTPLRKSVIYSSVHCSLMDKLGAAGCIGGVCDLKYIKLPVIQDGYRNGTVTDCGDGMNPDMEKIIDLHPDAILLSPFENSGGYGRVEKLNIPIIECADYMETSALGRAEWMRFYGLLFGKAAESDSLFARVEADYLWWAGRVADIEDKPTVFADLKSGATWYVPGGRSTVGRTFADAGADYVFSDLKNSGSSPLSFETVYEKAKDADIWLIKYNMPEDKTYRDLKNDYAPYAGFRAFRERRVYGCNTGRVPYYEETPFHPEWLLEDLIKIFHPDVAKAEGGRYFRKLAD